MLKLISWNVNGLRACYDKGFADAFRRLDADFFCLQETKMQEGQLDAQFEGYRSYWNYAEKKGYSGTAVFSRLEPLSVTYGMGIDEHDHEGRVITLELDSFFLITVYTPNSQDGLRRLEYRMKWEDDFRAYLKKLEEKKPVIVCGDLNVAHREIDLKNPKTNRKNAGFTDEERAKFTTLLDSGFTDTFRYFYPEQEGIYSWWSYRFKAREKNAGWRIDYFLASASLNDKLKGALTRFLSTFASMKTLTDTEYIHALIAEGEHQQQDFKFEISDARKIAKTLSAFANTDGGKLLIGVKDNGKIAGVRSDEEQYMIEAAAGLYCSPEVNYTMQTYLVEGRSVLVVQIEESDRKPVYAKDETGKYLAYLRIKDENILATPVHLRVWQQSGSPKGELIEYTEREQLLLNLLEENDRLSLNRYCRLAHLSRRAAEHLLAKFVRYDIVEPVFEGHKFHFRLK